MPFQLTIAEGKEAGKEFAFDQESVVIGRTPECDVCVYDPGISRKHARIFAESGGFFVEDLNSANGTKVNGAAVKKTKLGTGDMVVLGGVKLRFEKTEAEAPAVPPAVAGQETRIVQLGEVTKPKAKVSILAEGASQDQKDKMVRSATTAIPVVSSRTNSRPNNLAARPATPPAPIARAQPQSAGQLSAAERARIRRQSSGPLASLKIFWAEAGKRTRLAVYGVAVLALLGLAGAAVWAVVRDPTKLGGPAKPEPTALTSRPIEESFGSGDKVTYVHEDKKTFDFIYNAPVKAVVILHFQAKDISQGEVQIFVNGASLAPVPPDTLDVAERMNEIIVPPPLLKKGEANKIMFVNLHYPKVEDDWRIWNVSVETALLPEMPIDQLVREASDAFQRGQMDMQRKDVGAENRFLAWKEFRKAWLMLESAPDPKPELYLLSRDRMKAAQQELDRTCAQLLLEVEGDYNQKNWDAARSTLDHVKEYFPTNEQPCPFRAEQKRYELGL
jgi:hypothetical protein